MRFGRTQARQAAGLVPRYPLVSGTRVAMSSAPILKQGLHSSPTIRERTPSRTTNGNGQLVLLPDQDLLLVLSEEGELAMVGATPDQFNDLAWFPALDGKTWNIR